MQAAFCSSRVPLISGFDMVPRTVVARTTLPVEESMSRSKLCKQPEVGIGVEVRLSAPPCNGGGARSLDVGLGPGEIGALDAHRAVVEADHDGPVVLQSDWFDAAAGRGSVVTLSSRDSGCRAVGWCPAPGRIP